MAGPLSTFSLVGRSVRRGTVLLLALALTACANRADDPALQSGGTLFGGFITPYRMDIVQGNVVTQEQVALAKPGMSRAQVRDVLGSPMLTDMFHVDRWDYIFTIRRQGTPPQRRDVVVYFKDDKLDRIEAPELPTERDFVASISRPLAARDAPVLEMTEAQKKALPKPVKPPAEATVPTGAVRSYPPLEPS
jgi:outer membrane protein assembly factor BamE